MPTTRRAPRPAPASKRPTRAQAAVRVLRKLRLVFNSVKAHFREVEKLAGVAGAQVWAMSVVRDAPGIGVKELARAMDIHQSTASNLLKPLIESAMVIADRTANDRRMVQLRITPRGLAVLKKAPAPEIGLLPAALAKLDPETLARLDQDLEALLARIAANPRDAKVPLGQPEQR